MTLTEQITQHEQILLVEPDFPVPPKSRNHHNFLPIGLLKIASLLRKYDKTIQLVRYNRKEKPVVNIKPTLILVTSIFTYWSKYVREAVQYYREQYPSAYIIGGGIYASLLPEHCRDYAGVDEVIPGQIPEAEELQPAYDLVDVDYQILHTSRGCIRRCGFCGVYTIEPEWQYKKTIAREVCKKKLIFYDNNLLANPFIEHILRELISLRRHRKISYVESQSGFDGRLLIDNPEYARLLREAGFKNPRIAWDGGYDEREQIREQIDILVGGGYRRKDISVFMIYNFHVGYEEMEYKRAFCFLLGVQVTDCRYRPLDSTVDGYNPRKRCQSGDEYFISENWCDEEVRGFRRNVRRHNICVRVGSDFHSSLLERGKVDKSFYKCSFVDVVGVLGDAWCPGVPDIC